MQLYKGQTKTDYRQFAEVPRALYATDNEWVPIPFDELQSLVFDNKYYQSAYWVLRDNKRLLGRIAAFVPYDKNKKSGLGFFECVDSQTAANQLFDAACAWLKEQGENEILGPINAGDRDRYWGLMIERSIKPTYGENYNPPYYEKLFLDFGFTEAYTQYTPILNLKDELLVDQQALLSRLRSRYKWDIRKFEPSEMDRYISDFVTVYNDAWTSNQNHVPLNKAEVAELFGQMKPILDENLIYFAYRQQKPVGFFVAIPDINPLLAKIGRASGLWFKLKWLFNRKRTALPTAKGLIFGIVQSEQNTGVLLALADAFYRGVKSNTAYQTVELSWIGSFNPKMLSFIEKLGAKPHKKHRTYRLDINNRITK